MTPFLAAVLVASADVATTADQTWLKGFAEFKRPGVEVVWAAPSNDLPAALWFYKVIPQDFTGTLTSNLMAIGGLTVADSKDASKTSFCTQDKSRSLLIVPANGWIQYWDSKAAVVKGAIEGVPTPDEAKKMAVQVLARLGFPCSGLANIPGTTNLLAFSDDREQTRFDPTRGKAVTETSARGVYLVRQVDGIPMAGIGIGGGAHVKFGNRGKIAQIELVWRNLQRIERRKVATTSEIVEWIKDGRAVMTRGTTVDSSSVKKLIVKNISPLYASASGSERQNFVSPFAKIKALAQVGETNAPVILYCPIITDEREATGPVDNH
jgi:hypothetical protein